jgi:hypothetical protein
MNQCAVRCVENMSGHEQQTQIKEEKVLEYLQPGLNKPLRLLIGAE